MKTVTLIFAAYCCLLLLPASAQFYTTTHEEKHSSGTVYSFPIVHSTLRPDVAKSINEQLQTAELDTLISGTKGAFSKMWPQENTIGGTSDYSWKLLQNNDRYITLLFNGQGCGAYCEGYTNYYNFDLATGERLSTQNLLATEGMSFVSRYLIHTKNKIISDAITKLNKANKPAGDGSMQQVYQECKLSETEDYPFQYSQLSLSDSAITIYASRCSNHAMAGLDDVGDFALTLKVKDFSNSLSPFGLSLLNRIPTPMPYVAFTGTINNTINITALVELPSTNQAVHGVYFYNRQAGIIHLAGNKTGNNYTLTETDGKGTITGKFDLTLTNDKLTGKWINPKTQKEMPVLLKAIN